MTEAQNVEWKISWRDEYLKWIRGFANAQGGILDGGRDDRGKVVAIENSVRLLEEIPNKVRAILGIMVDVNLQSEAGAEYLRIVVEPCPHPISYKSEHHYRKRAARDRKQIAIEGVDG